jgi:hypothetical protein
MTGIVHCVADAEPQPYAVTLDCEAMLAALYALVAEMREEAKASSS